MRPRSPLSDEERVAVALSDCYQRLRYEVRRLNQQKYGPTEAQLARLHDLRSRIAALKRGEMPPAGWSS